MLFFVLSGFVLALPFLRERGWDYGRYLIKRLCRIYVPFLAAILFSAVAYQLVRPVPIPELSHYFNHASWNRPIGWTMLAGHLLMTGHPWHGGLDHVMWSLVYELRISIIFPLLVMVVRWRTGVALVMAMALGVACDRALWLMGAGTWNYLWTNSVFDALLVTGHFIPLFVAGIALAKHADWVKRMVQPLPGPVQAVLWLGACTMLMRSNGALGSDFWFGASATLLIALSIATPAADRLLTAAPLQWLGKISYSLYLIHIPMLLTVVHLSYGRVPFLIVLASVVAMSLIGAEILHRLVEEPATRLGRRLASAQRYETSPAMT